MYWYISNLKTKTCSLPYYVPGTQHDFAAQLVVEDGESFQSAYLSLVDNFFLGTVKCRIEPSEDWLDVGGIFDSTCFVGSLVGPCEVSLEFRIEFEVGKGTGEFIVPIQLFHGEGMPGGPSYPLSAAEDDEFPLFGEEESDAQLWNASEGEAPWWESGSMCGAKEYLYLPPGEALTKWDTVRIETDGTVEAYQAAGCVSTESEIDPETIAVEKTWVRAFASGTLGEANCIGIIDDDCVNYEHALDGVVVSDGGYYVYWQGGSVDSVITDRVWRLNRITRLWDELAVGVIAGRIYHAGIWYDGCLYIWGGKNSGGTFLNSIYRFDPSDSSWTALTAGGTARCLAGAMLVDDEIHFVGGVDSGGNVLLTVDIYSITDDSWSAGTSAPAAFADLDIAVYPLARPVWQVCDGTLFYGGSTAGRDEVFWTYAGSAWTAPATLDDMVTPGRGNLPNVPLKPTYAIPQHCVRIQPYGTDGVAEWIGLPTEDGRIADIWNEDLGTWSTLNIAERRALTQGFCTDSSWTLTIGQQQWLGATEGSRTTTRPAAGWIQVLGEAVSATTFCFNPHTPRFLMVLWKDSSWVYDGTRYGYNFGGDDGTGVTGRLRRLDNTTMQWEEMATSSVPRSKAGFGFSAGYLYAIGGIASDGTTLLSSMSIFDTWTGTWNDDIATSITAGYDQVVTFGEWADDGFWAGEWDTGRCYRTNAVVYNDGAYYRAIKTHLSSATNEPGTGEDWEEYWETITELPDIYVITGIDDSGGYTDEIWVYDPNEETWTEGIGLGSDFTDSYNVAGSDFTAATEEQLGLNAEESNEWACGGTSQMSLAGIGTEVWLLGVRTWLEGGEIPHSQRTAMVYDLSTDTWGASFDLSGDFSYSDLEDLVLGYFPHSIGWGTSIYLFGHGYHITGVKFLALKLNTLTGELSVASSCRAGYYEVDVNDRVGCCMDIYDGHAYFYGGHGDLSTMIDSFDFETEMFSVGITQIGIERWDHNSSIKDGVMYLFYGQNSEGAIATCNKIDLATSAYSVWEITDEDAPVAASTLSCNDDDGNIYVDGNYMCTPGADDEWTYNENVTFFALISPPTYYSGALYWAECEDSNPRMYRLDFGAGYIPLPLVRTIRQNPDGSFTVTWSTGETFTTLFVGKLSSSGRRIRQVTNAYNFATGMTDIYGTSDSDYDYEQTVSLETGWTTDDGGQESVNYSWQMVKTADGAQTVSSMVEYSE